MLMKKRRIIQPILLTKQPTGAVVRAGSLRPSPMVRSLLQNVDAIHFFIFNGPVNSL
jgi:hypothetical protein